jgi:uncharacterized membrane protein
MSRALFLSRLKDGLTGMPDDEIRDILSDYEAHFAEAEAAGRSDNDVEAGLGDPARLAKELRAEAGLKSWEENRSPKNFLRAGAALMGLATLDFLVLLPLGFVLLIVISALLFAFGVVGNVGFSLALSAFHSGIAGPALVFAGLGLICLAIGAGALILMLLAWGMRQFGSYVRLHYRVLEKNMVDPKET